MLAALAALLLAASLIFEAAARQIPLGRWLAVAGLAFLILAVLVPYRPPSPQRSALSHTPHFGVTRSGLHVHLRTLDHLPVHNAYARFNKAVAVKITGWVGSMSCAWVFCILALASLPAVLTQAFHLHAFPSWLISVGLIALVAWIAQTFLQLVLLSIIIVGSNVQAEASDARAAKTFDDCEALLDRLDEHTEGGIKAVLDAVNTLASQVAPRRRLATQAERDNKGDPAGG